jgi:hypothetical protein
MTRPRWPRPKSTFPVGGSPASAEPVEAAPDLPPEARPAPRHPVTTEIPPAREDLTSRVRQLLEGAAAPAGPSDADSAEAVCALRWPKRPVYRGDLDLAAVGRALHGRRIDERTLTRLGGSARVRPARPALPSDLPQGGAVDAGRAAGPRRRRRRKVDDRTAAVTSRRRTSRPGRRGRYHFRIPESGLCCGDDTRLLPVFGYGEARSRSRVRVANRAAGWRAACALAPGSRLR